MPIFFQQDIDADTRLAIWKIEEDEEFFLQHVPLQRAITHPHKRLQHLAGRYLLQYLFADFPINLIKIADTRKPFLEDEAYHFSISHCTDYAAAIVSKTRRVGVDVEIPSHKVEKIKHKFLHPEELARLQKTALVSSTSGNEDPLLPLSHDVLTRLTLLWSAKEAVFKWWSYGNVDFSEMIRLQYDERQNTGYMDGSFIADKHYPLRLQYKIFDGLCLAWIANDLRQ